MTPRNLYLLEVLLAVLAGMAFVLLASDPGDLHATLSPFGLW